MSQQISTRSRELNRSDPSTPMARRAALGAAIGTSLEFFDFAAYGALSATVFPQLFFSELSPVSALLASFATFGVGLVARPLGGLFFGMLGDRVGRRTVLTWTLVVMGTASALIGFLPTFAVAGVTAPILLVALRLIQGFALGGETTGAQLMTIEHAPRTRRGQFGSFIALGNPISQVLSTLTMTGLAAALSPEDFSSWGWRIPLIASLLLVIVGIWIRRRTEEPAVFAHDAEADQKRPRALAVFKAHPGTIVRLLLTWAATGTLFYITTVFVLSYLTGSLGFDKSISFGILLIGNLVSIPFALLGGRVADRLGKRTAMLIGLISLGAFATGVFAVLDTKNIVLIVIAIAGCLSSCQFMAAAQPAFFAESFPTRMRYTGSAAAFTGASMIFSATAPFIATAIMASTGGHPWVVALYGFAVIAISLSAILLSPRVPAYDW
jgi:MFS family permease